MATAAGAGAAGVAQPAPTPNPVLSFPAAIPSQNEAGRDKKDFLQQRGKRAYKQRAEMITRSSKIARRTCSTVLAGKGATWSFCIRDRKISFEPGTQYLSE